MKIVTDPIRLVSPTFRRHTLDRILTDARPFTDTGHFLYPADEDGNHTKGFFAFERVARSPTFVDAIADDIANDQVARALVDVAKRGGPPGFAVMRFPRMAAAVARSTLSAAAPELRALGYVTVLADLEPLGAGRFEAGLEEFHQQPRDRRMRHQGLLHVLVAERGAGLAQVARHRPQHRDLAPGDAFVGRIPIRSWQESLELNYLSVEHYFQLGSQPIFQTC